MMCSLHKRILLLVLNKTMAHIEYMRLPVLFKDRYIYSTVVPQSEYWSTLYLTCVFAINGLRSSTPLFNIWSHLRSNLPLLGIHGVNKKERIVHINWSALHQEFHNGRIWFGDQVFRTIRYAGMWTLDIMIESERPLGKILNFDTLTIRTFKMYHSGMFCKKMQAVCYLRSNHKIGKIT